VIVLRCATLTGVSNGIVFRNRNFVLRDLHTARLDLIAVTLESVLSEQAVDGRLAEITGASL
jgi:hypothetical protein